MGLFNDLVHLDKLYTTPVRQLSLGQRMLCDIAASFLHNPKVIFLDEPTIGLDVVNKGHIRTIIRDLNAERKTTVLLTSHDVGDIENLCRRIVMIDKGVLVYDGNIERFNTMFGAWRTLQLECDISLHDKISAALRLAFPEPEAVLASPGVEGWIDVSVNQDKAKLADVLAVAMREFPVSDVKIREIALENVIRRVYQEAEHANIS